MIFHYCPSCCKSVSRFPYVGRISLSVEEKNDVNFINQFVKHCTKYDQNFVYNRLYIIDESVELSRCNFSNLPDEVLLKVLKNLDLRSLCRMSQVNKRLNEVTRDWSLYTCVRNVRLRNPTYNTFCYVAKYKYLQQLDLTASKFSIGDFEKFLDNCGRHLTHLRLCRSSSVNNIALLKISKICKNLKELDLRLCKGIDNEGYSYLENLEHLEHLCIGYTFNNIIETQTLCKILQNNQQMRELCMENMVIDLKRVTMELRKSCRNLEVINLKYLFHVSPQSINTLADCKNLRKITTFRTFYSPRIFDDSLNRLFSSCPRLEEVYLHRILTDDNLNSLTQCKNLKKLYLYDMKVTSDWIYSIINIFEQCPKLQELHLMYCNIAKDLIKQWRKKYPYVSVFVKTRNYQHYHGIGQHISASANQFNNQFDVLI